MWKETETQELKESLNIDSILETICAFANTRGGTIYAGVSDDGKVKGMTIGKNTIENLANDISRNIEPALSGVGIEIINIDDKEIVKITTPMSMMRPHFYHRKAYCRVGKATQTLSPSQLEAAYAKKLFGMQGIDNQIVDGATNEDIDGASLKNYVKEIGMQYLGKSHALRSLNLLKNGQILCAAILFFGSIPEKFFPLYGIKCSVMAGGEITEIADFRENIYLAVDRAVGFVLRNIPSSFKIEGTRRIEIPKIPKDVIREAVVNAVIHRDYSIGSGVFVQISRECISIKNPGVLPPALTIEDLYKTHHSEPRNKLLAELAFKVKMIEQWGMGTGKIVDEMRKNGLDDPVFLENKGYFEAKLPILSPKFNERQKRMLEFMKNGEWDILSITNESGASERTVRTDMDMLTKKGFIKKQRYGKRVLYRI